MDSIRFNYGDLVLVDSGIHDSNCNIGYIINPISGSRTYHGVILFGSDEIWWIKDTEMSIFNPALTTKTSEDIL